MHSVMTNFPGDLYGVCLKIKWNPKTSHKNLRIFIMDQQLPQMHFNLLYGCIFHYKGFIMLPCPFVMKWPHI